MADRASGLINCIGLPDGSRSDQASSPGQSPPPIDHIGGDPDVLTEQIDPRDYRPDFHMWRAQAFAGQMTTCAGSITRIADRTDRSTTA